MAKAVTVKVEGLRELDEALGEFTKATAKGVLRRVGMKALQSVADMANALAPDDPATGGNDLSHSFVVGTKLTTRQAKQKRRALKSGESAATFVEVYAGTADPAGVQQEFGNVNHGPQPSLRPAWDAHKEGVLKSVATDLGAEIAKAVERARKRALRKAMKAAAAAGGS